MDSENSNQTEVEIDTDEGQAIPFYVIKSAVENAPDHATHVVVQSNNDYEYADSLEEANRTKEAADSASEWCSPINHTSQVVELQETPPEA